MFNVGNYFLSCTDNRMARKRFLEIYEPDAAIFLLFLTKLFQTGNLFLSKQKCYIFAGTKLKHYLICF